MSENLPQNADSVSADEVKSPSDVLVTWRNLDTLSYVPKCGVTRYEIADGVEVVLKRPTYALDEDASKLAHLEDINETDPEKESYSPKIRRQLAKMLFDAEDLPENIDLEVVGRAIQDFFMYRIYKRTRPTE